MNIEEIKERIFSILAAHEIILPHHVKDLIEEGFMIDDDRAAQQQYQDKADEAEETYNKALAEARDEVRRIMMGDISPEVWEEFIAELSRPEFIANLKAHDGPEWLDNCLRTLEGVAKDYVAYRVDMEYGLLVRKDL